MRQISNAERLIVAADFKPDDKQGEPGLWARRRVSGLCERLIRTGVYVKVNSALRAFGSELIYVIKSWELRAFADLKLSDIRETLATDGALLRAFNPDLLTVMCSVGVDAMRALRDALPETEVLGVTVPTNLTDADSMSIYGCSVRDAVRRLAELAAKAEIGGLVSSAAEVPMLRQEFGDVLTFNTPAIRPAWSVVAGDDQNPDRIMTPAKAIKAGADRVVIGRPILQAADPRAAVARTLDEIAEALH